MSHLDLFAEDPLGITGSEPRPHDITPECAIVREALNKIQLHLQSSSSTTIQSKRNVVTIDFSSQLERLERLWLDNFAIHNHPASPCPINMNDSRAHIYYMYYYCQYNRKACLKAEQAFLAARCPDEINYNYQLLVDGCCAST